MARDAVACSPSDQQRIAAPPRESGPARARRTRAPDRRTSWPRRCHCADPARNREARPRRSACTCWASSLPQPRAARRDRAVAAGDARAANSRCAASARSRRRGPGRSSARGRASRERGHRVAPCASSASNCVGDGRQHVARTRGSPRQRHDALERVQAADGLRVRRVACVQREARVERRVRAAATRRRRLPGNVRAAAMMPAAALARNPPRRVDQRSGSVSPALVRDVRVEECRPPRPAFELARNPGDHRRIGDEQALARRAGESAQRPSRRRSRTRPRCANRRSSRRDGRASAAASPAREPAREPAPARTGSARRRSAGGFRTCARATRASADSSR